MMPDDHVIRIRHIGSNELDARILQGQEEGSIAIQPVELCDHERGIPSTTPRAQQS
jgi:hypothetical protein